MRPAENCQDERRALDARRKDLNGIDYIEVGKELGGPTLTVCFFGAAPDGLAPENIVVEGGTRITGLRAVDVQLCKVDDPDREDCARVLMNKDGDFSVYTFRVSGLKGFDPLCSQADFSFQVDRERDLDCQDQRVCPPDAGSEPEINYLAKDYATFRQLILDRWALIMPSWSESHVPDLGIALVEVLAYVGDYLSYFQDAVATEAYLGTARQRISVRRHARLVGYNVHEGCNARTWICVNTPSDLPELSPNDIYFITGGAGVPSDSVVLGEEALRQIPGGAYEVFEPVSQDPIHLFAAHSSIGFYTWGNHQCCLAKGSTHATLLDGWEAEPAEGSAGGKEPSVKHGKKAASPRKKAASYRQEGAAAQTVANTAGASAPSTYDDPPRAAEQARKLRNLKVGDILLLMEVRGPETGSAGDADPQKRHAVRLTRVEQGVDELYKHLVVNVWWDQADALPFALCLSSLGGAPDCAYFEDCSVACANVILVDHGQRFTGEGLTGYVPLLQSSQTCLGEGRPAELTVAAGTFNPALSRGPLTFRQPVKPGLPASKLLTQDPTAAQPQITLQMRTLNGVWDAAIEHGNQKDSATLLLQQDGVQLNGSYSGSLGTDLVVCGSVAQDWSSATFGIYQAQPNTPPQATVSCKFESGALSGEFDGPQGKATFLATSRRRDADWMARPDLLGSGARDNHFVVEVDNDSLAHLRFGDGELGQAPEGGAGFIATYRTGNGTAGNVGRDTVTHMVLRTTIAGLNIAQITNPLPAAGGTPPDSLADVKLQAPSAVRTGLQRAVTADDYATLAAKNPKVQRAAASLRWTGSRYAVQVTIDPFGAEQADPGLLEEIKHYLYRFRRIGHDLEVFPAAYVPLDLAITVSVQPEYLRAHVKADLLNAFSSTVLPDGKLGFFHPDNLTFGDSIYVSRLVATAQAVSGVASALVTKLERLYQGSMHELENGVLVIGPLEVARLDRDPNFPENGTLRLDVRGGR